MVCDTGREGIPRHIGVERLIGALHNSDSAATFDGGQPRHAVVQHARQQDADRILSVINCNRTKQHIDGRTVTVFGRSIGEQRPVPATTR